jgi:hypothetical protein
MRNAASDAAFVAHVKEAVRKTVVALGNRHGGEVLAGYALLTDDGLGTLGSLAVTREALRPDPEMLFTPTDWPYDELGEAFDGPNQELGALAAGVELKEHVDATFGLLVQALADLRREGVFAPDVYLAVISTDPSEYLEALAETAFQGLNSAELTRARREWLEKWQ